MESLQDLIMAVHAARVARLETVLASVQARAGITTPATKPAETTPAP